MTVLFRCSKTELPAIPLCAYGRLKRSSRCLLRPIFLHSSLNNSILSQDPGDSTLFSNFIHSLFRAGHPFLYQYGFFISTIRCGSAVTRECSRRYSQCPRRGWVARQCGISGSVKECVLTKKEGTNILFSRRCHRKKLYRY